MVMSPSAIRIIAIAFVMGALPIGQAHSAELQLQLDQLSQEVSSVQMSSPSFQSGRKIENSSQASRNSGSAFFKSLLIPGWGQYTQGRKGFGAAFFVGEVLLITGIVMERTYSNWLKDDYRNFATQHAGVLGDKGHQYYVDIGNWMDTHSYNEKRLRERSFDDLYLDSRSAWSWDSDQNRREFKATRLASDHANQKVLLMVGGLLLNHMISGIEASRVPKSDRKISLETNVTDEIAMLNIGFLLP